MGLEAPSRWDGSRERAARKLPSLVSMKSSPRSGLNEVAVGGIGGSRNAPLIGDRTARRSCMVRCRWRGTSPGPASGFRGRDSPLIDGCRESEVSLRVIDRRYGLLALEWVQRPGRAFGRRDATGARSGLPCQDGVGVVVQHTSCVRSNRTVFAVLWPLCSCVVQTRICTTGNPFAIATLGDRATLHLDLVPATFPAFATGEPFLYLRRKCSLVAMAAALNHRA